MNNPLVSICIPTYNGEKYLNEAFQSVLSQTYQNIEVIISDDASIDNTLGIVKTFKSKTNCPVFIFSHEPNGIGANWNNCIRKSNGEYIKFLFQDDVLLPNCISDMMTIIQNYNNIGLVGCKREFIIEQDVMDSDFVKKWIRLYGDLQKYIEISATNGLLFLDKSFLRSTNFLKWPLNKIGEPSTYLFKKDVVNNIGYFREDLIQILDYEFCYRIIKKYRICIIEKPLCKFRIHSLQATQKNRDNESGDYKIYNEIIRKEFFWYLNHKEKLKIMRSKYKLIDILLRVKGKLKL